VSAIPPTRSGSSTPAASGTADAASGCSPAARSPRRRPSRAPGRSGPSVRRSSDATSLGQARAHCLADASRHGHGRPRISRPRAAQDLQGEQPPSGEREPAGLDQQADLHHGHRKHTGEAALGGAQVAQRARAAQAGFEVRLDGSVCSCPRSAGPRPAARARASGGARPGRGRPSGCAAWPRALGDLSKRSRGAARSLHRQAFAQGWALSTWVRRNSPQSCMAIAVAHRPGPGGDMCPAGGMGDQPVPNRRD
jgi:hypothetical protein